MEDPVDRQPTRERLDALASAIADHSPIDWDAAEQAAASDDERETIRQLRFVHELERAHDQALSPDALPANWGPLTIQSRLGSGRFGEVFRAYDRRLDHHVALKLLRPEADPAAVIVQEGRLLAKVRHPNVASVYGADTIGGRSGIWMELVEGRTLESEVGSRGPLSAGEVLVIARDVCRALVAVHDAGLLHRDIKAQNIMRATDGRIVVMDFGASLEAAGGSPNLAGTPLYLAPEVIAGQRPSPGSDIYSLGVLMFFLATGSHPFRGRTLEEIAELHRDSSRGPQLLRLPKRLRPIVSRAMNSNVGQRFGSAREMLARLDAAIDGRHVWLSRAGIASVLVAVTMVATAVGALFVSRTGPNDGLVLLCRDCSAGTNSVNPIQPAALVASAEGIKTTSLAEAGAASHLLIRTTGGTPDQPVWSVDGERFAYVWWPDSEGAPVEVRVRSKTGIGPGTTLFVNNTGKLILPLALARDDRLLAAFYMPQDRSWSLGWVGRHRPEPDFIKSFGWRFDAGSDAISLSPDAQWIVYSALAVDPPQSWPYRPIETDRNVYLMRADGRDERPLTRGAGIKTDPVWSRDGRFVLFVSNAAGSRDLWAIEVNESRNATPTLIFKDLDPSVVLGMDAAGRFYFHVSRGPVPETVVMTLDGRELDRFTGAYPAWAPEGERIAVMRTEPGTSGNRMVVVHKIGSGAESTYPHPGFDGWPPMWYPDGRSIMKLVSNETRQSWSRLHLATRAVTPVIPNRGEKGEVLTHFNVRALARDGLSMFFGVYRPPRPGAYLERIVRADLATGQYRLVTMLKGPDASLPRNASSLGIAPSPNGRWVAIARYDPSIDLLRIERVGVDGSDYRELTPPLKGHLPRNSVAWSPDSAFVYFSVPDGNGTRVMKLAAEGGTPTATGVTASQQLFALDVSPVGALIAFSEVRPGSGRQEIWSVDLTQVLRRAQ